MPLTPETGLTTLTPVQAEHFVEHGYVVVEDCFDRGLAADWIGFAYERMGCTREDPASWPEARVHLPGMNQVDVAQFSPRAYGAICDLMGGEARIQRPVRWGDGFIVNFNIGAGEPWQPPSARVQGWHKDGDWFRHFLDSPEQGLLTIVIWQDIAAQAGGTFIAPDSISLVARRLLAHPQGLTPQEGAFGRLIDECETFVELSGRAGDVALLHPYMLHSASCNPSGVPRFITNPPVSFLEPMRFRRADGAYSRVEAAVLRALGVDGLDFAPAAARERITPERVARQQRMLAEQKARLGL